MEVLCLSQCSGVVASIPSECLQEMIRKPMKCGPYINTHTAELRKQKVWFGWVGGGSVVALAIVVSAGSGTWPEVQSSDIRKTLCAIRRVIRMSALLQAHDGLWTKQAFTLAGLLHPRPLFAHSAPLQTSYGTSEQSQEEVPGHKSPKCVCVCPHERVCECSNSVKRRGAARHC